jgi:hypothetical protein
MPVEAEGYIIKSAVIDEACNAYFLMGQEKPSLTASDRAFPEILVKFDVKRDTITGHLPLKLDSAYVLHSFLRMTEIGDPLYVGVASGDGIAGLNSLENSDELDQGDQVWTHFFFKRIHCAPDMKLLRDQMMPIPQAFSAKCGSRQKAAS